MEKGLTYTATLTVDNAHSALAMGSGDMPVLATPAMVALMENAAMMAVAPHLPEGSTTVGGQISTSHLRPSGLGAVVSATATTETMLKITSTITLVLNVVVEQDIISGRCLERKMAMYI